MKDSARNDIYLSISHSDKITLLDYFNGSSFDSLFELDVKNNTIKQIYHVMNKYFMFDEKRTFIEVYDYVLNHLVHPDDKEEFAKFSNPKDLIKRLKKKEIPGFDFLDYRYLLQDGTYRYIEEVFLTGKENGVPPNIVRIYTFDVHNYFLNRIGKESDERSVLNKEKDPVTGLLTNKKFLIQAEELVERRHKEKWCLISIDIEHFRFFNEWYGREVGETLLSKIGTLLHKSIKKYKGVAGYVSQDDFLLLVPYKMENIKDIYENMRKLIISYGSSFGFLPAFGIALIEPGMMVVDALDRASLAVNRAKKENKDHIYTYNSEKAYAQENEYHKITAFMEGFKNDEITFFLQPQCRISNKKIVGAEALARWQKKDGSLVSPIEFIPVLEKYGFITDLDQYLWDKVCAWLRKRLDEKKPVVPISLNISRMDIKAIDVASSLHELAEKYKLPHKLIKVEITESAYMEDTEMINELVPRLRKDGFLVLMDDFGSGYSSLNMLSNLKIDVIKLDANFLHIEVNKASKGLRILESVITMSKQIALPVVVEGVETKEQSEFLESLGVRYVQGYHFYRPMQISTFEELIDSGERIDETGFVIKLNEQFRIQEFLDKNIYSDAMLNNILGPVAIYSYYDNHVDIIRFNQQFYEAVNVPDFQERLVAIEQFLPEEDRKEIIYSLKMAKKNRLSGYTSGILRFGRIDGTLEPFRIHFYYLGKKEGRDNFYGSAHNVTQYVELLEELKLVSHYGKDNFIFIHKEYERWVYKVVSHGLSDLLGYTVEELEEALNDGGFRKRIVNKEELSSFMFKVRDLTENKQNFEHDFIVLDKNDKPKKIKASFTYVGDRTTNIQYILNTTLME